jgi:hypothetical protein
MRAWPSPGFVLGLAGLIASKKAARPVPRSRRRRAMSMGLKQLGHLA